MKKSIFLVLTVIFSFLGLQTVRADCSNLFNIIEKVQKLGYKHCFFFSSGTFKHNCQYINFKPPTIFINPFLFKSSPFTIQECGDSRILTLSGGTTYVVYYNLSEGSSLNLVLCDKTFGPFSLCGKKKINKTLKGPQDLKFQVIRNNSSDYRLECLIVKLPNKA